MATELYTPRVVQHDSGTRTPPPVEILLYSGNGDTPWVAALSTIHLPIPRGPRIAEAAKVNPRVPSFSPSPSSTVLVPRHPFIS